MNASTWCLTSSMVQAENLRDRLTCEGYEHWHFKNNNNKTPKHHTLSYISIFVKDCQSKSAFSFSYFKTTGAVLYQHEIQGDQLSCIKSIFNLELSWFIHWTSNLIIEEMITFNLHLQQKMYFIAQGDS